MATGRTKKNRLTWGAAIFLVLLNSCNSNGLADITLAVPGNNWLYSTKASTVVEIPDPGKLHDIYFNLRLTSEYKYANIYILFKMKGSDGKQIIKRFGYKVAEQDGQWTGRGSGNIYAYQFPVLKKHKFPAAGKYQLIIEQNMRDNPLRGVSDIGLSVETSEVK